jgi:hypothetical protein
MFGLQALRNLFNPASASAGEGSAPLSELLGRGTVAVISASCCDAMSTPKDEALAANLDTALERTGLKRTVAFGTLTGTREHLRAQASTLDGIALEFRNQLGALFQTRGLAAFPLLLVDGRVVFYGGIPSAEAIAEKLTPATGAV